MDGRSGARSGRRLARGLALLCGLWLAGASGCATLTGLVTGGFTGLVDAPAQMYRYHEGEFNRHPEYWPYNILFVSPVGMGFGPLAGMAKGIALDVEWCLGEVSYGRVFGSYRDVSVWRPYTIHW